jgi:tRNA(fMet)-specific endonuclease VapC
MNGRLLDTNIVIAFFASDKVVEEAFAQVKPVFVSAIVLGELYSGARKSGRVEQNLARIDQFAAGVKVLSCDMGTARHYGIIRQALRV